MSLLKASQRVQVTVESKQQIRLEGKNVTIESPDWVNVTIGSSLNGLNLSFLLGSVPIESNLRPSRCSKTSPLQALEAALSPLEA